jgi:hypothetical protein
MSQSREMAELMNAVMAVIAMAAILWTGYDLHRRRRGPF